MAMTQRRMSMLHGLPQLAAPDELAHPVIDVAQIEFGDLHASQTSYSRALPAIG